MIDLQVEVVEPKIVTNFVEFKNTLDSYTKKFEIEVTSENIKDAKKASANLNKIKANIKSEAKKYIDLLEVPINTFKDSLKEIDTLLNTKRLRIVDDIAVFEDAKKLEHIQIMRSYMLDMLNEQGVREEFRKDTLPNPSIAGLSSTGNLLKKFKDEINTIVVEARREQDIYDMEMENKRLKDEKRANEIVLQREQAEKERLAKLAYREPEKIVEQQESNLFNEPVRPQELENVVEQKTKSTYEITLTFKVNAKAGVGCDAMLNKVIPMILDNKIPVYTSSCKEV